MTISYEKKYLAQEALLLWDIRKNKNRIKKIKNMIFHSLNSQQPIKYTPSIIYQEAFISYLNKNI